jgi:hypothetical protein
MIGTQNVGSKLGLVKISESVWAICPQLLGGRLDIIEEPVSEAHNLQCPQAHKRRLTGVWPNPIMSRKLRQ